MPVKDDLDYEVDETFIVELYSNNNILIISLLIIVEIKSDCEIGGFLCLKNRKAGN